MDPDIVDPPSSFWCGDYCVKLRYCSDSDYFDLDACVGDCEDSLAGLPGECFDAVDDRYLCLSRTACEAIDGHETGDPEGTDDYACKAEDLEILEICGGAVPLPGAA